MKSALMYSAVFASIAVSVAGCTSIGEHASRQDYMYPPSISTAEKEGFQQSQRDKAEIIARASVEEVNKSFYAEYQPRFPNTSLMTGVKLVEADKIEVTFNWESPRAFFKNGKYNIKAATVQDGRDGMAFIDLVTSGINLMTKQFKAANIGSEVQAVFYGTADGTPVRSSGLIYRGEYGDVTLPSESTKVNGNPTLINIKPNQSLTNEELAALRAWSLREFAHHGLDRNIPVRDAFEISVSPIVGQEQRSAKVRIFILPSRPSIS